MLKKLSVLCFSLVLASCSSWSSVTNYIPFMGNDKKVINLDSDKIDQKSYATAYEATIATYKGRVNEGFYVDNFASGAKDWNDGKILVPVNMIQEKVSKEGLNSDVFAYYNGVLHASELQTNFNRLNKDCWSKVDAPSITQGIYDAMRDLQKGKERGENDEYISQGSEALLKACSSN